MEKTIEELAAERRKEYYRNYRNNNKERLKENNANYWKRKILKEFEQSQVVIDSKGTATDETETNG